MNFKHANTRATKHPLLAYIHPHWYVYKWVRLLLRQEKVPHTHTHSKKNTHLFR